MPTATQSEAATFCPKCRRGGSGPHPASCTPERRFWRKVKFAGACWEWQGSTNGRYGEIRLPGGVKVSAHRFVYERCVGDIPPGYVVMHTCDNPRCVRPAHLTVGTQADNIHDAMSKRRFRPARAA